MDNDILINQARRLYAALHARLAMACMENTDRLDHLLAIAYCRYQRRLNRCVLCYRQRGYDCIRIPGEKTVPCKRRQPNVVASI